ncbi:imidazole glycerol phosphate synthase subunit HisH [soil metagenome]
MIVAIVRYNAGNVQSVIFALERLGITSVLTDDPELILKADKVIFPGVGEASTTMAYLKEKKLDEVIRKLKQPVLGICLGMQLLCKHSEENDTECIGIFDNNVKLFPHELKVPHTGWNSITDKKGLLFKNMESEPFVYYVHSYYAELSAETKATTNYILPFSAALQKNNFYAVQFHPEKSARPGETILQNFLNL